MRFINAKERCLSFDGDTGTAMMLVESLREVYAGNDMPKMLNDFVFNIEVALQNTGVIDEHFEMVEA